MSRLSDLADRWPVIGPAVGNAAAQVALIWGADLDAPVQATITGLGTILTALLSMTRAWRPASVEAAKATAEAHGAALGYQAALAEHAQADAYDRGRAAGVLEILEIASREPAR